MIYVLLALTLFSTMPVEAAKVTGRVFEKGTKTPLPGTTLFWLPSTTKVMTDTQGYFEVDLPEGSGSWVINLPNYNRFQKKDEISSDNPERIFYVEKQRYVSFETTILGQKTRKDETLKSMKADVFQKVPGAGGDPVKAITNLPGVARQSGFDPRIVIQGSAPEDTRYLFDGIEVPNIFHFGLTSVAFPESIERVDYLSAGYGPEWGRAMGGVIQLWTRSPRTDRMHLIAFADLSKIGAMVEAPLSENTSALLGFRHSYIGAVLGAVLEGNDDFNLTVAPEFSDVTGIVDTKVTPIDDLHWSLVGSRERLAFLLKEPVDQDPEFRGDFDLSEKYFRIIPQWTHRFSHLSQSRVTIGAGKDWQRTVLGDNYFFLNSTNLGVRAEVDRELRPFWKTTLGIDNQYSRAKVEFTLPGFVTEGGINNPFSTTETKRGTIEGERNFIAMYWRNDFKPTDSPWTLSPNFRTEYFAPTEEFLAAPRGSATYQLTETMKVKASGGIYHQPPQPQELASNFGNPELASPRAYHASMGLEKDFREGGTQGLQFTTGMFYKSFDRLIVPSTNRVKRGDTTVVEIFGNQGLGRAYGWEALLLYDYFPLSGWLSYTLSRSERWKEGGEVELFQYDQTHNVNMIASYEISEHWSFSARVRYVTGNPVTPVIGGTFDADNDVYIPKRGPIYSERLSPFFQADLRIDKKWIYDTWILSLYLDIQNLTNAKNPETIQYSYDYRQSEEVVGLPILPILGVKGEF